MAVRCCALILLCCLLQSVSSFDPSPLAQKAKYINSFRLSRSTRTRVQQLLKKYNQQQLGNEHFEDRGGRLKDLPLLSTDFHSWLQLSDWERLQAAFVDIQTFRNMLEWKRKQLEKEDRQQVAARTVCTTLFQGIKNIQLDLRDLMIHVGSQMSYMKNSTRKPTLPAVLTPTSLVNKSKTVWENRVEGYIILRDLDLYLIKLARDFLLLASKTRI